MINQFYSLRRIFRIFPVKSIPSPIRDYNQIRERTMARRGAKEHIFYGAVEKMHLDRGASWRRGEKWPETFYWFSRVTVVRARRYVVPIPRVLSLTFFSFFFFFFFPIPSPVPSARIHVQRHERTCVVRTKRDRKFKARVAPCIRSMKYLDDRVRLCIATKGRYTLINGKIIFNRGPPPV